MNDENPMSEVKAIRQLAEEWTQAVEASNVEKLGSLMTEDIVVVHGNGRVVSGKRAVMDDIMSSLATVHISQLVHPEETIVTGDWAFDRAHVHTRITYMDGGEAQEFDSHTITILHKEGPRGWRVARAIGVQVVPQRGLGEVEQRE